MRGTLRFLLLGLALMHAGLAAASTKSVLTVPVKGLIDDCARFSSFKTIRQMGTNRGNQLQAGQTLTLTGPDNPMTPDTLKETVKLSGPRNSVSFRNSTTPVDFVVLRDAFDMVILYYPAGGVTSDDNLQLVVNGVARQIDAVNFCYGLGNTATEPGGPPAPPEISSCPASACADNYTRNLMCNFDLSASNFGGGAGKTCCICNEPRGSLPMCDPNAAGGQPNACIDSRSPSKVGLEIPSLIEFNKDPYVCSITAGKRTCYGY